MPWRSSLTRALAALPPTLSQMHAAQIVLPLASSSRSRYGRFTVVGAHDVYLGLRFGPKPLARRKFECRETHPSNVDPPELARTLHRLQRRRVVPSDHPPGLAVDQDQILLRTAGPGEVARDQHVVTVEGHVEHLGIRAPEARRHTLSVLFRLGVEDRHVGHAAQDRAITLLDPGEVAADPDVGADLLDGPDAPVDHGGVVGLLRRQRQYGPAGKEKSYSHRKQQQKGPSHPLHPSLYGVEEDGRLT